MMQPSSNLERIGELKTMPDNETLMGEIKRIIGPAATAKIARAVLSGNAPEFTLANEFWTEDARTKGKKTL